MWVKIAAEKRMRAAESQGYRPWDVPAASLPWYWGIRVR